MTLTPKCALFQSKGYAIEKGVLQAETKSLLRQIEAAIGEMALNINAEKNQYLRSVSRWDTPNPHIKKIVNKLTKCIKPLAEEYFGQKLKYVRASIIRKSMFASLGTHGHQDAGYWSINASNKYDLSTWVALEDIDRSNGALRVLSGSHLNGAEAQGDFLANDFLDPAINWTRDETLNMSAGDVAIFDPYLWHASHPCSDSRTRVALVIRWCSEVPVYHSDTKQAVGSNKFGMETTAEYLVKSLDLLLASTCNEDSMTKKIRLVLESDFEGLLPEPDRARTALQRLFMLTLAHEDHYGNDGGGGVWVEVRDSVITPLISS